MKIKQPDDGLIKREVALGHLFDSPQGQDALELLAELYYDRPSYVPGDPHHTSFKEGQRDVVGYIKQCINLGGGDAVET